MPNTYAQIYIQIVFAVKAGLSNFINDRRWMQGKFNWQEGFGEFSYSKSQIDNVGKYILKEHHTRTMKNICLNGLNKQVAPKGAVLLCYVIKFYKQHAPMERHSGGFQAS